MCICEICGRKTLKIVIKGQDYLKCDYCGFLTKDNYFVSDEICKQRYNEHEIDNNYVEYQNKIFANIKKYLNKGVSLDFGCGRAHTLSNIFYENNLKCDYYDKYFYPNFPNSMYDNIILIEVIEHIKDVKNLFQILLNMLNPNGKVIIHTQIYETLNFNWWYLRDITHVSFFTINSFIEIAKNFNFQLIYDKNKNIFVLEK